MLQTSTLTFPHAGRGIERLLGLIVTLAGVAGVVVAVVSWISAMSTADMAEPSGIITYATSEGVVEARTNGEVVTITEPSLAAEPSSPAAAALEEFPSPVGRIAAFVERADDGIWLAIRDDTGVQRVAQLADSPAAPLIVGGKATARTAEGVPLMVSWSTDGRHLAYGSVSGAPYVLNVVDSRSWSQRRYALRDGFVGELVWSPDGRLLAVSSYSEDGRDHTAYVVDTSDGRLTKLIDGCGIVWSPDSRFLALHRDVHREPGLWLVLVESGDAEPLTRDPDAVPNAWRAEEGR